MKHQSIHLAVLLMTLLTAAAFAPQLRRARAYAPAPALAGFSPQAIAASPFAQIMGGTLRTLGVPPDALLQVAQAPAAKEKL